MYFLEKLTSAHQAILLFIWVYLIFGLAWPLWRRVPSDNTQAGGVPYLPSLLWIIVAVVTFVAWLRLMIG